jgi:hypothetical protein
MNRRERGEQEGERETGGKEIGGRGNRTEGKEGTGGRER